MSRDAMFDQRDKWVGEEGHLTRRAFWAQHELWSRTGSASGITPVTAGGTGLPGGTSGGILAFTAATVLASSALLANNALMTGGGAGATPRTLASLGTATTVLHGNASGAPTFGAVSLTTDASGILQAAQFPALLGDVTTAAGSLTTAIGANKVTLPMMAQIATAIVLGRNTAGTGDVESLATLPSAVQDNITRVGTLASGVWNGTGVAVPFGGTGIATLPVNHIPFGNGTSPFQSSANLTFDVTTLALTGNQTISGSLLAPTINGGIVANDDITIQGTTHATRTTSNVNLQPSGGRVVIGDQSPSTSTHNVLINGSVQIGTAFSYAGVTGDFVVGNAAGNSRFLFGQGNSNYGGLTWNYNATVGNAYLSITTNANNQRILISPHGTAGVGFGILPTGIVHIKAGAAPAGTAPLKFTSGTLLTTAEALAVEALTDKVYFTITTGAARKEFTLNDTALTSGKIPVAFTNGRLVDGPLWDGTTLTVAQIAATTFSAGFTMADAQNIVLNATTGTQWGTAAAQKQSWWSATPIVQPTTAVAAATFVANTSGIVDDSATWDGYTMGQVVKALRNMGKLA